MRLTEISRYVDALDSGLQLFRTLGKAEVERNVYDQIKVRSGNSAAVFKIFVGNKPLNLKCHTKPATSLNEKLSYINKLYSNGCRILADARLYEKELYVFGVGDTGEYLDVVIAPWVEGESLSNAIEWAALNGDHKKLAQLAASFDKLALELLGEEWAHGDLKPDNIIQTIEGELVLIDYDALFIPQLKGTKSDEIGTPSFQHPLRTQNDYNQHIDDYPIALISVSLHALAKNPSLYKRFHKGDNIILNPIEILDNTSEAYSIIVQMWENSHEEKLCELTKCLKTDTIQISNLYKLYKI